MGAGSFGTLQLMEHGANRPVRLVTSSLWVFKPSPFCSPFLGAPRGPAVTKSLLSPNGDTVSPRFTLWPQIGLLPCTVSTASRSVNFVEGLGFSLGSAVGLCFSG